VLPSVDAKSALDPAATVDGPKPGQPIGEMDMMIAAHALAAGAVLVTNNGRHFKRINAPLILDNWA
jgi:predicted nucleic acid-binding protein